MFGFKKQPQENSSRGSRRENCKIKIKQEGNTKTLAFSGNCTKEQLEMAKLNLGADSIEKVKPESN